ncbi:phage tail tape measure protein [Pseudomonas fluorescens]|uniref:phage tail tape measure protein n=1 Tax=Pseudomonas fluorescens TaxID=294 RepID=UPI002002FA26|nr:phage tail tape measure protein [Pseudomonas fluorescens]MCK3832319.1 phage tail tape measure protein [Pseudomonas fluorescens]
MQHKYSLAYAMVKDGQGVFSNAGGAKGADSVNPGPMASESHAEAAPLSSMGLELTNAGLQLQGLSLSLGLLRDSVDALQASLPQLTAMGIEPSKTEKRSDQTTTTEVTSSTSQELRLIREAMTLSEVKSLDPVAAFQQSFAAPAIKEKTIAQLREASSKSEERLSTTLKPAPVLWEDVWLQKKTEVMDKANAWASTSPAAATTVKTAEAVILPVFSPVFTDFFSGLGDTIKSRVTSNVVDVTLGKLPGVVGKLFKSDGFKKDQPCCCATATQASLSSRRSSRRGSSVRKRGSNRPKSQKNQKARNAQKKQQAQKKQASVARPAFTKRASVKNAGVMSTLRSLSERFIQPLFPAQSNGFHAGAPVQGLQPRGAQVNNRTTHTDLRHSIPNRAPGLIEASERRRVPVPSGARATTQPHSQAVSHERSAVPVVTPAPKIPASGLLGVMSKLESAGARRLGPLKYVDTAVDVVQGVRNGDVKAVGAGLSTAGGAWAGASAGAALGTLVFPGIGTAVGGAIGGLLGSEAGSWLGDKLFGSGDRLPAPNALSKELNSARTDNVQITLSPSIQITGVNPADAQQVVNQVIQALQFQCVPMVTDSLGIRRNAALADPSGGD